MASLEETRGDDEARPLGTFLIFSWLMSCPVFHYLKTLIMALIFFLTSCEILTFHVNCDAIKVISDMDFTFFIFRGLIDVELLSP